MIDSISLAKGQGLLPIEEQETRVTRAFAKAGILFDETKLFKNRGPDIVAISGGTVWKVECKGMGTGKAQTHKNNFDRALASVVSYYDKPGTRLGLALANDYLWKYSYGKRLPKPLREALEMWVLLVSEHGAFPYEPTEELPYPGALD
jgi:hypothetical protein